MAVQPLEAQERLRAAEVVETDAKASVVSFGGTVEVTDEANADSESTQVIKI